MTDFKLIGIRPHKDCGKKFLKLLEPGRLYQFYNDYHFFKEKDIPFDGVNGDINYYELRETVPSDLFKIGNLNINISAVVGKNGTGKSTLIELLLYATYLIGRRFKDPNSQKNILPSYTQLLQADLEEKRLNRKLLIENMTKYETYISNCLNQISKTHIRKRYFENRIFDYISELNKLNADRLKIEDQLYYLERDLELSDEDISDPKRKFNCSLIFSLGKDLYEMSFRNQIELSIISIKDSNKKKYKIDPIDLTKHFFYSTILNYSHHSLNSNHVGYWVNSLFHKNDGYKTPAVINPMREEGNFDINKEVELSKSRLLVNSLINQLNDLSTELPISEKQSIESITIKVKENKNFTKSLSLKWNQANERFEISGHVIGKNTIDEILVTNGLEELFTSGYNGKHPEIVENLLNYLVNKVHRIQNNYSEYFDPVMSIGIDNADQIVNDRNTIKVLNGDYSHVSFKYHRSIFFLRKMVNGELDDFFEDDQPIKEISLVDYLKKIDFVNEQLKTIESDLSQVFLRVPPPIFDVDFNIIQTSAKTKERCKFEELSSGEQQSIHTINTFIYHLNNTYSVHKEALNKRQKYHFFNAVFDEIELYFHPDLQRRFINDLLITLRNNKHLSQTNFIKDINLIFSTHSPFILSDIPEQNILQLEYNYSDQSKNGDQFSVPQNSKRQTFGANIHDLLSNSFFLSDSFKGEHAHKYFGKLIYDLNNFKSDAEKTLKDYKYFENKINIIAEPFIKSKLFEKLDELFNKSYFVLDEQIRRKEDEIKKLKEEKNDSGSIK